MRSGEKWISALAISLTAHVLVASFFLWCARGLLAAPEMALTEPVDTRVEASAHTIALKLWESPPKPRQIPKPVPSPLTIPVVEAPRAATVSSPAAGVGRESKGQGEEQEVSRSSRSGNEHGGGRNGLPTGITTAFFQIPTRAHKLVFVIDRSASMGLSGLLDTAKRELLASLERLPPTALFQVIVYNRQTEVLRIGGSSALRQPSAETFDAVGRILQTIDAEGGTDHLAALKQALLLEPEVIYFLTDAAELRADQVQAIRAQNQGHVVIHTIELRADPRATRATSLENLARDNNGSHRFVEPSSFH
jgi:hypothetical protein